MTAQVIFDMDGWTGKPGGELTAEEVGLISRIVEKAAEEIRNATQQSKILNRFEAPQQTKIVLRVSVE